MARAARGGTLTLRRLRALCLARPGASEVVQWGGIHVFKVGGRMFATLYPPADGYPRVSLHVGPASFHVLTGSGLFRPAPYLARAWWVSTDDLGVLAPAEWEAYVARAWRLVVERLPRRLRLPLLAEADGPAAAAPDAREKAKSARRRR